MLPISASDIIEFKPAAERVATATAELEEARAALAKLSGPKKKGASKSDDIAAAEMLVSAAQEVLASAEDAMNNEGGNPTFNLRVPTERSKAAVNRDISAEAIVLRTNLDVLEAALNAPDELSPDDAEFLTRVRDGAKDSGVISDEDWPRVFGVARSVRSSAGIIADWLYHATIRRVHLLRHHLIIEGEKTPLPERVFDEWMAEHRDFAPAVGEKIDSFLTLKKSPAKN